MYTFIPTTWNPDDKSSDITLSNNDLTATLAQNGHNAVRSIWAVDSGKWYWELSIFRVASSLVSYIGIGNSRAPLDQGVGDTIDGYAYRGSDGDKCHNGSSSVFGEAYSNPGDIVGLALNMDTGKIWWSKNGIWQGANYNPTTDEHPAFSGITGMFYAMLSMSNQYNYCTANFGASSFSYSVPFGFWPGFGELLDDGAWEPYTRKVYFYNTNLETRTDSPMKLVLNESNFNFDLAQNDGMDFRLAERANGSGIFKMWVASWDKNNKHAVLWFKIPYLSSDSKTTFYALWGGAYSYGISNPEDMGFLFYEAFLTSPLDTKWVGNIGSVINEYGYEFPFTYTSNPYDDSFITSTNSLIGKKSWIMEASVYLATDTSFDLNDRAHGINFIHKTFGFDVSTWNPEEKSSRIRLSNGNLTVSCSNSSNFGVRSKWWRNSGKWYWEVSTYSSYHTCIGIANQLWNLVDILGRNNYYSCGYQAGGYTWYGGSTSGMDAFGSGDVIGVALDMDTGKIWWSKNGVWQAGGDPVAGTGARYSGISGEWYAAVTLTRHYSEYTVTNFGTTDFAYPTPSGFVAWTDGDVVAPIMDNDENDFIINVMHDTRIEHNAIYEGGDTYHNIDQTHGGLEFNSYQEYYIAYNEPEDRIYQRITGRNTYADIENKIDRKVEGDTRPSNVQFHGYQQSSGADGAHPSYINWFILRDYVDPINLDGSDLYIQHKKGGHQTFDYRNYGNDLTLSAYPHKSSFGGTASNISNNLCVSEEDVWASDINAVDSDPIYVTIYLDRTMNLASSRKVHYDDGHEPFYAASKMSDSDVDVYGRDHWRGVTTSGIAVINFGAQRPAINVFGIKMVSSDLNAGPKDYKIYGGWEYPDNFKLLHEGTFEKTAEWQSVTFINKNPYKHYKLEVINTYGNNIKIQEWALYNYVGEDKPKYVSQLRLHPADFSGLEDNFPKYVMLEGSNDMLNWEELMPWTNTYTPHISHNIAYGKWQRYSFTNIKGYWHYRLGCKDNWSASDGRIIICGWELCELIEETSTNRILAGSTDNIKQIWAIDGCGFEDESGLIYIGNEKLNVVQGALLVEEKDISEFYDDINVV